MVDALSIIYNALIGDPFINQEAGGRIKYYEYPETASVRDPYIVLDPLDAPMPAEYGDDTWLMEDFIIQVDVWSKNRSKTREISRRIQEVLWNQTSFRQNGGGVDEWDKDTGIYREARRYRAKIYKESL